MSVQSNLVDHVESLGLRFLRWMVADDTHAWNDESIHADRQRGARTSERTFVDTVDPAALESPADVAVELGMMPAEFVTGVVDANDGRVRQSEFLEYTNWSRSTVSHLLSQLEDEDVVERVSVGSEKLVCLPDHSLESDQSSDVAEPPPAGPT